MTPESLGHDLTARDPADAPRCPMEGLADRFKAIRLPNWATKRAYRDPLGGLNIDITAWMSKPEQLDDLIAFLQEVRG